LVPYARVEQRGERSMASVRQLPLQCLLYLTLVSLFLATPLVGSIFPTSWPDCPDKCGNVTIPYPFGTLPGCYREGFDVTCNESFTPPKPFLWTTNIDLLDINITTAEIRVHNYIGYRCYNQTSRVNGTRSSININRSKAFLLSNRRNKFTVIGCYALAYIIDKKSDSRPYQSGCVSFCDGPNSTTGNGGSCNGLGCCQTTIPAGLNHYEIKWGFNASKAWSFNPCSYAALIQEDWYNFTVDDLVGFRLYERNKNFVPIVLDWAIRENGTCLESHMESSTSPACISKHSGCDNTTNGEGYICKCLQGYDGNPYLPDGCMGIALLLISSDTLLNFVYN
jgi:Wall-associated receptor kinase galacturonan-binding